MSATEQTVQAFLDEIEKISRKYGLSIAHEDEQGAFLIDKFSDEKMEWLKAARIRYKMVGLNSDQ